MPKDSLSKCYRILDRAGYRYEREDLYLGHGRRRDFCGFADLLAWRPGSIYSGVLAIQSCMEQHLMPHMQSMADNERLYAFLSVTRRVELWCWAKRKRGKKHRLVLRPFSCYPTKERDGLEFIEDMTEVPDECWETA